MLWEAWDERCWTKHQANLTKLTNRGTQQAIWPDMQKSKKSTFQKCGCLHLFALVCAFVRSLCAPFCGDQIHKKLIKSNLSPSNTFEVSLRGICATWYPRPHSWLVWVHGFPSEGTWARPSGTCRQEPHIKHHGVGTMVLWCALLATSCTICLNETIMEPTVASLLLQFFVEFSHGVLPLFWNPGIQKKTNWVRDWSK